MLAYRQGRIEQKKAARFLGIRKEDFALLASEWAYRQIEEAHRATERRRALRDFIDRFLRTFPECDPRAYYQAPELSFRKDPMFRAVKPGPVTVHDDLQGLPPSQSHLTHWERLTGTDVDPVLVRLKAGMKRPPAYSRNRLRVSEPDSFEDPTPLDPGDDGFSHAVRGG